MFYFTHEIFKPFTWSLRGTPTSHFIYILNLNFILQTNYWTYNCALYCYISGIYFKCPNNFTFSVS